MILLIMSSLLSCIQFKPEKMPLISLPILEEIVVCGKIMKERNWAYPRDIKTVFIKGKDKRIYCFLILKKIEDEHFLEWKWYDPEGKLYRSTERIKIGEKGVIYEKFIAWDGIILFREKKDGKWKIAIFLDNKFLDMIEFEIKENNN
ncbi:hypothetical protein NLC82_01125 [Candidatus Aminicenantes bacterium AC-335-A11]|nr:hypothetical protein [Candidatus Aminicenantes bacterium AC-335-A11]